MANMNVAASWSDLDNLADHLGAELSKGRLALFLGAGLSMGFKLPNWESLVARLYAKIGETPPASGDNLLLKVATFKLAHFRNNDAGFSKLVNECLYAGGDFSFDALRRNDLVAAIGALVMASQRGQAASVITLNFDDLLERYLEFNGLLVQAVSEEHHWASNDDVRIYHPHGILPVDDTRKNSESLVFGMQEFHKIISGGSLWRPLLDTILRTHTTIYIGLSGDDMHLQSLLNEMKQKHAISRERYAYHGVMFGRKPSTDMSVLFDEMGVHSCLFDNYDELPPFLFRICQAARKHRLNIPY